MLHVLMKYTVLKCTHSTVYTKYPQSRTQRGKRTRDDAILIFYVN